MLKPSRQVIAALSSLGGNPDFEVFVAWLQQTKDEIHSEMAVTKDDVLLRWHQGSSQLISDFLDIYSRKNEIFSRMNRSN